MTRAREELTAQLKKHGDRRRAAAATSKRELEAIAQLLPAALEAGITKREISRLTGVGRPTIDSILSR